MSPRRNFGIVAHRGFWTELSERNTRQAFRRAFEHDFGIETDIRDQAGRLVVSHDPPVATDVMTLGEFTALRRQYPASGAMAMNIKADGLARSLRESLEREFQDVAFFFDMSVPDTLHFVREGLPVFTRQSEYEAEPALYDQAGGIWLDCFHSDWFDNDIVLAHVAKRKRVALVSPELHGRDHQPAWRKWKALVSGIKPGDILICTDHPLEADRFFNGTH